MLGAFGALWSDKVLHQQPMASCDFSGCEQLRTHCGIRSAVSHFYLLLRIVLWFFEIPVSDFTCRETIRMVCISTAGRPNS